VLGQVALYKIFSKIDMDDDNELFNRTTLMVGAKENPKTQGPKERENANFHILK
jgi:hypothetical protein